MRKRRSRPVDGGDGARDYGMGFGAHYRATPRVVLRADGAECEIVMEVENLSAAPMDLMYMCHVNIAFAEGARIVQPVPFTPQHVVARTAIPGHVVPTEEYRELIQELAANPARMRVLNEPERYDPEQVFYIKGLKRAPDGLVHFMLLRREGDATYDPLDSRQRRPARGGLRDAGDLRAGGLCRRERKGNVHVLSSGAKARFVTRIGYLDKASAPSAARNIEGSAK